MIESRENVAPLLRETVGKKDLIKFRDPASQKSVRRSFTRGDELASSYQINLCEFRNE